MATSDPSLIANTAQAGDIVLLAFVFAAALAVGLALFGIDQVVGRLRRRAGRPVRPDELSER